MNHEWVFTPAVGNPWYCRNCGALRPFLDLTSLGSCSATPASQGGKGQETTKPKAIQISAVQDLPSGNMVSTILFVLLDDGRIFRQSKMGWTEVDLPWAKDVK